MIRTIYEFLLSRSLDKGQQPASGILRRARREQSLQQMQQLDAALRTSALEVRQQLTNAEVTEEPVAVSLPSLRSKLPSEVPVQRSSHSVAWLSALAVAAVLLLMFSPNWFRPSAPSVHAGEFSRQLTVVPGKVLDLITRAADTSTTRLPQLSPLNQLPVSELPSWQKLVFEMESPLRTQFETWRDKWPITEEQTRSELPE